MPKGGRRSRSRSPPDGGRGSVDQRLRAFRKRYPADERAFDFLAMSHPKVVEQVLADWKPPHENQDDYSALLTNFVRQVRNRLGCQGKRPRPREEWGGQDGEESDGAGEEEASRDPQGDRGGGLTLRDLVAEVGAVLGRGQDDVEPLVSLLEENWFDTVESLEEVSPQDLAAVGLPLRFARELVAAAGRKASSVDLAPAVYTGQQEKGKGKGGDKGKGKSKGKGKGKGKGKTKGKGKGKDRDWDNHDDNDEHELARTIPVQLNGLRPDEKKGRLLGNGGEHFKYIRNRTKSEVWLEGAGTGHGDPRDPLCVRVRAESRGKLDHAVELVEDLLAMIAKESRRKR